jgi:adenylate cyclase
MLRLGALISAFVFWSFVGQAQNAFLIDGTETPETVDALYAQANASPDMAVDLLDQGIGIAQNIHYKAGVLRGYSKLIGIYQEDGNSNAEMRVWLFKIKYFESQADTATLIDTHLDVGSFYLDNSLLELGLRTYMEVQSLSRTVNPNLYFHALKKVGWCHHQLGKYTTANKKYEEAIEHAMRVSDYDALLWLYQQQGDIAHQQALYNQEIEINSKILKLAESLDMGPEVLIALNNLGYGFKFLDDKQQAGNYFNLVLATLTDGLTDTMQAEVLKNLGILHQNNAEFSRADSALAAAAVIYQRINDTHDESAVYDFLALVHYQKGDVKTAQYYNKKAVKISAKKAHLDVLASSYRTESLIYQSLFEYENALLSYEDHLKISDSLATMLRNRQNDIQQQQYFLLRMEKELKLVWEKEKVTVAALLQLQAETEAKASLIAKLQADTLAKNAELRSQVLEARRARDLFLLQQEQNEVDRQKQMVAYEQQERKLQEILLDQERDRATKEEQARKLLAAKNENQELLLQQSEAQFKNLLFIAAGMLLVILLVLFAYRQLRSKNVQIAKQQVVIAAERDKSDMLLLNILPAQVAAELKEFGSSKPRAFSEITVVFTDFVGFTMISESLSPEELVATLDKIFLEFDLINERNGLQRIKTIGDAYMCACGLPEQDDEHARKAVRAAIEMRDFVNTFNDDIPEGSPKWKIRIGLNSGPVVAGVVGIKKFAYDIWGDTVNVAARMESSGKPGKVNISADTFKLVGTEFHTEHRGQVEAKNKGKIDMYFVETSEGQATS